MLIILILIFWILTSIILIVVINKLLAFDSVWDQIDETMTNYVLFLEEKTKGGLLSNHPEVLEFHKKTVEIREKMKSLGQTVRIVRGNNG